MSNRRALIIRGKLKYNPMDSHFWFHNEEQDRWVRMPRKWCEMNAPGDYVRLMEAIGYQRAKYKEYNLYAYNQVKSLYLEISKTPEKYQKNNNEMDIYEAVVELLMYKGHLVGKNTFDVWKDILHDVHR